MLLCALQSTIYTERNNKCRCIVTVQRHCNKEVRRHLNEKNIPDELKACRQWICHKDKIPKSPLYNGNAKPTDPATWGSYEQAIRAVSRYGYSGLGFVFAADSPYCGIDIDHCIDRETGEINRNALDIVEIMDSYTERSPSGTGLHIIYKGAEHPEWKRKIKDALGSGADLEMYQSGRYFTVTGNKYGSQNHINERDGFAGLIQKTYMNEEPKAQYDPKYYKQNNKVADVENTAKALRNERDADGSEKSICAVKSGAQALRSDSEIITLASRSNKGFPALYSGDTSSYGNDESRADAALCAIIAFYTKDAAQIDRLFRSSGLMRDKWNRKTGASTYGAITIENALKIVKAQYDPSYYKSNAQEDFAVIIGQNQNKSFRIEIPKFQYDDFRYKQLSPIETARFFAECIDEYAAYVPQIKDWKIYDGTKWIDDSEGLQIMALAKVFVENIMQAIPKPVDPKELQQQRLIEQGYSESDISEMPLNEIEEKAGLSKEEKDRIKDDNDIIKSIYKYYSNFEHYGSRRTLLNDTKDILSRSLELFDRSPYLFNLQNGTLDLKTMQFREHRPDDLLTACAGCNYDPSVKSELFRKFIDEITEGDKDKALYLQKALGYSMKGIKNEECFFLLYGATTRNGKGTLLETVLSVFGDYGAVADFGSVARSKNQDGSKATPDLARLRGARFVKIDEPSRGVFFDEGLIKKMTGGDKITARHLYGTPFEYTPGFAIFISANSKPNVSDTSVFESDRVKLILFNKHFSEEECDTFLKEKLREDSEKSGILNWLIEGYKLYQSSGLKNTAEMNEQLTEYAKDSDEIQRYIDDRLELSESLKNKESSTLKAVRNDYIYWCQYIGTSPIGARTFKEDLVKRGVIIKRICNQDRVFGKLRSEFFSDDFPVQG